MTDTPVTRVPEVPNDPKEEPIMKNTFKTLNAINVSDRTEKKNGLTYLSWAWAWAEVKKLYPDANYHVYERDTANGPVNYFTDGRTAWVKTGVFINDLQHIEMLPVMDYKNRAIPLEQITSTDVNKAIQRSLTKAIARHGLGLYIYAGEDLPEDEREVSAKQREVSAKQREVSAKQREASEKPCGKTVTQADPAPAPRKTCPALVKELCVSLGITVGRFGIYRNMAALNGIIPDLRLNELSDSDFEALMNFVRLNAQLPA